MRGVDEITEDEYRQQLVAGGWMWRAGPLTSNVSGSWPEAFWENADGDLRQIPDTRHVPEPLAGVYRALRIAEMGPGHRCPCCDAEMEWLTREGIEDHGGDALVTVWTDFRPGDEGTEIRCLAHEEECEARPENVAELERESG